MRAALLCVALATLPSCSLLGLDRLEQANCVTMGGDAFCASLEDDHPTMDACLSWQCNEVTTHCEALPLDADGDGAAEASCAPAGTPADCDDADPANEPAEMEMVCDGRDNDCDARADEDLVRDADLLSLRVLPGGSSEPVFGRAPDADESAIAVLSGSDVNVVLDRTSALLVTSPVRTVGGMMLAPTGLSAIEGLGANRYAMLFEIAGGGCPRTILGILDTSTMTIRVENAHAPIGFPNTAADCTMGATSTGGLGLDRASGDLLVAYLETAGRDCGTTDGAPVLALGAPDAAPGSAVPIVLGESVDPGPPAILPLGGRAFLVAFPNAAGAIEVHRVTLAADGTATDALATMLAADAGGLRGDLHLAAGETDAGVTEVALTYSYGCGTAPVALQLLEVSATEVTVGARVAGTAATGARHAVAVHQPTLDEWLLGWRTRMALGGLRVAAGVAVGDGFALSSTTGGYETSLALLSPGRISGYRALTVRTDGGTPTAVAIELGCLPPAASP